MMRLISGATGCLFFVAILASPRVRAADPQQVTSAKSFLTDTDRARFALFFAHPTATYKDAEVSAVRGVRQGGRVVPGAFAITVRYTWKNLLDETNTTDLIYFFNAKGRLTETQAGRTTSFFKPFSAANAVLNAIKPQLLKEIAGWDDAAARQTARDLIDKADMGGLLNVILQVAQP